MPPIELGRLNAEPDHDFVLFLIGMRVHRLWKVNRWLPVYRAMAKLMHQLGEDRQLGLLGSHGTRHGRDIFLVQCWESEDKLMEFSRAPDHRGYWKWYNTALNHGRDVGLWHETYRISAGSYDGCYLNMPVHGLADAVGSARLTHTHGRRPVAAEPERPAA
ncbi:MAG: monooxygenase family protein [Natronosporangium sp.]